MTPRPLFIVLTLTLGACSAADVPRRGPVDPSDPLSSKYIRTPTGYLMVLRRGDDVLAHLERLAVLEQIPGASFSGFGFVNATFGFYDFARKTFDPRSFRDTELASMNGSIAWKDGVPVIHAHAVVTDRDFAAHGGHLLGLEVGTGSVEITILLHDQRLGRAVDPAIGANVMHFVR
ncbi:PPC domain-containing DNA-binding protein [Chondromyces crocatus]|uniref:PPC domain-containing protein n=1 Tax=Chondromyces crocatus TaxID=52 RepID=A0A0K1EJV8_CHOCO|nr:PPC domain-containing DNA-binding protein [Chondromyces crocatus]AKT40972.1 uncharacterized protein CMC5_051290 [Chondromyces crocatus]